jgi:hypothetical protein
VNPGTGKWIALPTAHTIPSTTKLTPNAPTTILSFTRHPSRAGNPGTGKTTVAQIYGRALKEIGLLSDGGVEVIGASKLIGDVVGSAATAVNALIDRSKGKVVIIDEAYVLADNVYGKQALDTLVERVQGTPGEDMAVLLLGYEPQILEMLRKCNPGLARRFKLDDAFRFEDYDDAQLAAIMLFQAEEIGIGLSPDVAKKAVHAVLAKQRAKPNFGNAGAVRNLLDLAKQRLSMRQDDASRAGLPIPPDELEGRDLYDTIPRDPLAPLAGLVNADAIRQRIEEMERKIRTRRARGETDAKELLKPFCGWRFSGPPGTGKTTAARAFGEVLHSIGLLPDSRVVEIRCSDVIAGFVGQSGHMMREKMDEARGGVLFIGMCARVFGGLRRRSSRFPPHSRSLGPFSTPFPTKTQTRPTVSTTTPAPRRSPRRASRRSLVG